MADEWRNIGLALRLNPDTLNTIGTKENAKDCLLDVLHQWLKKTYNVKRFGEPSWKLLVKAVNDPAGGNDRALAEKIAQKHQGITWFTQADTCYNGCYIRVNYTSFFPVSLDEEV